MKRNESVLAKLLISIGIVFFVFFLGPMNILTAEPLRSVHPPKHVVDLE